MLPVILIPALFCDERLYRPLIDLLPDDLAASVFIPLGAELEALASDILERAPDRFIAAGTSFGGHVALQMTIMAPERVAGLWIMGAGAGGAADPEAGRRRSSAIRDGRQADIVTAFARNIAWLAAPGGKSARECFVEMGLASDPEMVAGHNHALTLRPDRWQFLSRITCPTLLVWGEHDTFSSPAIGRQMASLFPDAEYHELPGCGHLPSLEQTVELAAIASRWLKRITA